MLTHMQSSQHMLAAPADSSQPKFIDKKAEMEDQEKASYIAALRSAYWIAIEEIANRKHASLLHLQRVQGCHDIVKPRRGGNSKKESPWSFNQLLSALNEVLI